MQIAARARSPSCSSGAGSGPRCGLIAAAGVLTRSLDRLAEMERAEGVLLEYVRWAREDRGANAAGAGPDRPAP